MAASAPGVAILPYWRAAPAAVMTPEAALCRSSGTVTLARSSRVILNAGLSSVFAIISFSGVGRSFLLWLRRLLRVLDSSSRVGRRHQTEGRHALKPRQARANLR